MHDERLILEVEIHQIHQCSSTEATLTFGCCCLYTVHLWRDLVASHAFGITAESCDIVQIQVAHKVVSAAGKISGYGRTVGPSTGSKLKVHKYHLTITSFN